MNQRDNILNEIEAKLFEFAGILNMGLPLLEYDSNSNIGGKYTAGKIVLNQGIIENWLNKQKICEFVIVHELVHAKYNEEVNLLKSFICPNTWLELAFRELRANTIAFEVAQCSTNDLNQYFNEHYPYSYRLWGYASRSGGYLTGAENLKFILEHKMWNESSIQAAAHHIKSCSKMFECARNEEKLVLNYLKQNVIV